MLEWKRWDTWRVLVAAIVLWAVANLADLTSTAFLLLQPVQGLGERNELFVSAFAAQGISGLVKAFMGVNLLYVFTRIVPVSLAVRLGTRSWLLASVPWWWEIWDTLGVVSTNIYFLIYH